MPDPAEPFRSHRLTPTSWASASRSPALPYPCVQWRTPAGNLHEQSVRSIWHDSPVLQEIRETLATVMDERRDEDDDPLAAAFCPGLARRLERLPLPLVGGI